MALKKPPLAFLNGRMTRIFPFLSWSEITNRDTFGDDLKAAFTGALIMIPQGVAFATIAGMPPEYGLYAGMLPAIVAALFGSSWHLVSGPTTAASLLIFSAIGVMAEPGTPDYVKLVLTLTFMVGLIELTMGLLRMGALINFISHTVAIGFTAGAAILIAASQARYFFGLEVPGNSPFYEVALILIRQFDKISLATTIVGLTAIVTGLLVRKAFPKSPYMIFAMLVSSLLALALKEFKGTEVPTIGAINSGLPPLSAPNFSIEVFRDLALTAVAVALFALTEAVTIARSIAIRTGQQLDGNQEFIGQGLSNLVGGFFSGYVATGSFNRSALNFASGAKTPMAAVAAGLILLVITPFIAPLAIYLPKATVAGILFLVISGLIDIPHIRQIISSSKSETTVMLATFGSVLFFNLEVAIFVGVVLSIFFYLNRTSHPNVTTLAPDAGSPRRRFRADPRLPECPQVKIARIDGSLFFGAVSSVIEQLRRFEKRIPPQKNLLVVTSGMNFIDMDGAEALANEARRRRTMGGQLYFVGIKDTVAHVLERTGFLDAIGRDNIFDSKTAALQNIYACLDKEICANCTKRIFQECGAEPATNPPLTPLSAEPIPKKSLRNGDINPSKTISALGPRHGPEGRSRLLALIEHDDDDVGAHETVAEAWKLAKEYDADVALGQLINWKSGSGSLFPTGFLSHEMETALCAPARRHLKQIADDVGFKDPTVMATAIPERANAAAKLIEEWCPDFIVVHSRSAFDFTHKSYAEFETPFGRIRCRVNRAGKS